MIALLIFTNLIPPGRLARATLLWYRDGLDKGFAEGALVHASARPPPTLFILARHRPGVKKKDLEIALEKVPRFESPDPSLEQYPTPATIAADAVFWAYSNGDVEGAKVMDLGCGPGILSIGAWLMGAGMVVGYDVCEVAVRMAENYARSVGAGIEYRVSDVRSVAEGADTVIMNPPFGSQRRNADRPFLDKAMESAEKVYSIHMAGTLDFVRDYAEARGRRLLSYRFYKYDIPHTFEFHTRTKRTVDVAAVLIS